MHGGFRSRDTRLWYKSISQRSDLTDNCFNLSFELFRVVFIFFKNKHPCKAIWHIVKLFFQDIVSAPPERIALYRELCYAFGSNKGDARHAFPGKNVLESEGRRIYEFPDGKYPVYHFFVRSIFFKKHLPDPS